MGFPYDCAYRIQNRNRLCEWFCIIVVYILPLCYAGVNDVFQTGTDTLYRTDVNWWRLYFQKRGLGFCQALEIILLVIQCGLPHIFYSGQCDDIFLVP